ncbi:phosphoglycolate phosphatase [Stenoxybacter acetivorans]|uniref:phosphoglycolate phosphatase n=1 Tax=Stenoxybacter acetivorans TaxID=422441 RepID=UPI00056BACC9|nr:phosphoglycolate phosphatase [Stenoxybacter acetivorans]
MKWADIHAIAFDLDGTLIDSLPDLMAAANAMRRVFGLDRLPESTMAQFVGDGIVRMVHRALSGEQNGEVNEADWQRGFSVFVDYYHRHIADNSRVYPQVESALVLFRQQNLPLAVITNKNEVLAVQLLKALQLADYFSLIIGGDTLSEKKPSALPLLHTAEVLGVSIEHLLMVGDSANDILAAKAAGALCAGVRWGYGDMAVLQQQKATQADMVVDALSEIYDCLRPALPENQQL